MCLRARGNPTSRVYSIQLTCVAGPQAPPQHSPPASSGRRPAKTSGSQSIPDIPGLAMGFFPPQKHTGATTGASPPGGSIEDSLSLDQRPSPQTRANRKHRSQKVIKHCRSTSHPNTQQSLPAAPCLPACHTEPHTRAARPPALSAVVRPPARTCPDV